MTFEDINNFACCWAAENMLTHIRNMIDDTEYIVSGEDRKKLRQAHELTVEVLRDVCRRKRDILKNLEAEE